LELKPLGIQGAFLISTDTHFDNRGSFREIFRAGLLHTALGENFEVKQQNLSISNKGVIRGIHFTNSQNGQAKLVSCVHGSILDVVVDLRVDSPTFKSWEAVRLVAGDSKSIFIKSGLGHAFLSLEDLSVVTYLTSEEYSPESELSIYPFDPDIGIQFDEHFPGPFILSAKDEAADSLQNAIAKLP
jgi:dTDP-4-dehydrorhamnose 3,5-epimerase